MTLPSLGEMQPLEGEFKAMARSRRRRRQSDEPPPPPTGPTQAPLGFALVAIALLLITVLLGGCVQLETTIQLPSPGRLQISQTSLSATGQPLPWQQQLAVALRQTPLRITADHGRQTLTAPVLPAADALALLGSSLQDAARLAGVSLPEPQLSLKERNWLLGVRQQLVIELDLRQLQPLPGLSLTVQLEPMRSQPAAAFLLALESPRPRRPGDCSVARDGVCTATAAAGGWLRAAAAACLIAQSSSGSGSIARFTSRGKARRSSASWGSGSAVAAGPCSSSCQRLWPATRATGAGAGPMITQPLACTRGRICSARAAAAVAVALAEGPANRSRQARLNGTSPAERRRASSSAMKAP
jgi:hypothetical protein